VEPFVNVSSVGGRRPDGRAVCVGLSCNEVCEGLLESLRFELKQHGVLVKLVEPGHVRTDFVTRSIPRAEQSDYEPQLGNWVAQEARADHERPAVKESPR
jgi:short-subunit dehydrogenase